VTRWLVAFVWTQAVEVPLYAHALRARRRGLRYAAAFGASALTHPVVWFVAPRAWEALYLWLVAAVPGFRIRSPLGRYACLLALAETFAVVVEAGWLRAFGARPALAWALLANAASLGLGLAARALWGWP
jgi:hypothetical protein